MTLQALPFFSVIRHTQVTDRESGDIDDSGELFSSASRSGRSIKRASEKIIDLNPNKKVKSRACSSTKIFLIEFLTPLFLAISINMEISLLSKNPR